MCSAHGEQTRDFMYVDTLTGVICDAIDRRLGGSKMRIAAWIAALAAWLTLSAAAPAQTGKIEVLWLGQAAMKITTVEALPLAIPYHIGEGRGGRIGEGSRLDFCPVRVQTDEGLVGWGEAFSYHCRSAVVAAVRERIAPLAVGEDPLQIEKLQSKIQKNLHIFGLGELRQTTRAN